jgi:hypothetical protein
MKASPTAAGGLRIDAEDPADWQLLRGIVADAEAGPDLADGFGGLIAPESGAEDWREFVVPDLREAFHDELTEVGAAIESAVHQAENGPGAIWIGQKEAFPWYSALNQARLALEDAHHFGQQETIDPTGFDEARKSAFLRSRFYCAIQGLLLEFVLK